MSREFLEQVAERVKRWPEWKRQVAAAWDAQLREDYRLEQERADYRREYGEQ